jgi:hypothetical protein
VQFDSRGSRFWNEAPRITMRYRFQAEGAKRADRVQVSWDTDKSKWLIRIQNGEEVIRRHSDAPKNVDDQTLRVAVQKAVKDEGYELDLANIDIRH